VSESGKVLKVFAVDQNGDRTGGEWSQQLPVDPFAKRYQWEGLQEPPFSLEQMVFLAEQHPTHSAILEVKAADIVGTGWDWKSKDEKPTDGADAEKEQLEDWFQGLSEDATTEETNHEILLSAWSDLETIGQGMIELARDPSGKLRYWFRMPAHTCRFHRDGIRIAQERQGQKRWFKKWIPGDERLVDPNSGRLYDPKKDDKSLKPDKPANEVLVLKRPSRRSSWYGIPGYIPAVGWITLSTAARDDNLLFFENRREPRWAIILSNVEDDPKIEQQIKRALSVDLRKPHKNLVIPLSGDAKIDFQALGDNKGDMSWEKLQERADGSILLAHRMPGERIGLVRVGALGGSVVADTTRVYKESFVQTSQALLSSRINRLIATEGPIGKQGEITDLNWDWQPTELDLTEEGALQDQAVKGFEGGVLKLNEAREDAGKERLPEDDDRGEKFFWEVAPVLAGAMARAKATEDAASIHVSGNTGDTEEGAPGEGGLGNATDQLKQHIEQLLAERGSEEERGSEREDERQ
jgi:capsid portal protein